MNKKGNWKHWNMATFQKIDGAQANTASAMLTPALDQILTKKNCLSHLENPLSNFAFTKHIWFQNKGVFAAFEFIFYLFSAFWYFLKSFFLN